MKITKKCRGCLALLLSVLMLLPCMQTAGLALTKADFTPENLLTNGSLVEAKAILKYSTSDWVDTTDRITKDQIDSILSGVHDGGNYAFTAGALDWDPPRYLGLSFALDESRYIGEVVIDAGYEDREESYDVYVSDTESTLCLAESRVAEGVKVRNGSVSVEINKSARYVAVLCTAYLDGGMRIKQMKVMSGEAPEPEPERENLFQTHLESKYEVDYQGWESSEHIDDGSDTFRTVPRFNANGALDGSIDGDVTTSYNVYAYSDNSTNLIGARYHLDNAYYVDKLTLYSGETENKDVYRVYASEDLNTLYSDASNVVTLNALCDGSGTEVTIGRTVRYISIFFDNVATTGSGGGERVGDGIARVMEFQCWLGEAPEPEPERENLLLADNGHVTDAKAAAMDTVNQSWGNSNNFNNPGNAVTAVTDGDTQTAVEAYGGWDDTHATGVVFELDDSYYLDEIKIFAHEDNVYDVFVSEDSGTLVQTGNLVGTVTLTEGQTLSIGRSARYVGVFLKPNKGGWIAEIELFAGEKPADHSYKVLVIGNSFSQNASTYVTQIAAENGQELTFAYLKFPSCTLERHLQAFNQDKAVFRFEVVSPDGSRTLLKDEASDFDTGTGGFTIKEGLSYAKWDAIVFQQESFASLGSDSFEPLDDLVAAVSGYCTENLGYETAPRLLFHEVWRWGTWIGGVNSADGKNFTKIKNNAEKYAAQAGLEIIPSGLSFEYARYALQNQTIVNEDDGYYQHASNYGQYLAGASFVGTLFGMEIAPETFAGHELAQRGEGVEIATLTESVNKALAYYRSYRDLNGDFQFDDSDAAELRRYLLGRVEKPEMDNVSGGEEIDICDLVHLHRQIQGAAEVIDWTGGVGGK